MIAAVNRYYLRAGATAAEAECLASITGPGKTAVNQAFDVPKPGETEAAIKCVGSEARMRTLSAALVKFVREYENPFGGVDN